ncbi:AAA family ATPase [Dietzia cinnamea]|uniref:ATP-binding protein n=1 Tax=Dietzia TaxID=37914 RepID=UPI0013EABE20|nr:MULTISPECIES: AAA family ATPase [Dietzia]MCT1885783.1 AAA family ATPase [Dietzia cinnamea]MCT2301368.1 AAA family ATPase [Dietzia cinnamea]
MTSTATALTTTLPVAWWRRRGKAPRGAGQPDAMLLWCDPEAGPQLVAAYRGQSGLMLSADASLLSKEAGEAFTEAAPARAFADVAYLQVDDEGPTHEQLVQLLEGSPPAASMLGDLEGSVQAALAVPELEATPDPEPVQPSPSSTPASFAGPLESVPLRDGRVYRPRPVGDTTDVQILRQARGSLFTRIVGASGNGKTMLAEAAFGEDLIVVEGHGDLAVDDLVGKWIPREDGPGYRFAYGPLAEAMRQGKVLLIDDLTRAPSDTINVLMGPADDRRMLVIDALPDEPVLHAADGFHIVVTYNQTGVGVRPLDAAILRRFPLQLEATTDYGLVAELGVDARLVRVGRLLAARAAVAGQSGRRPGWAPQTDHLLKSQKALDMGMGVQVAASMLFAACPEPQHQPEVLDVLVEVFGSPVGPLVQQELQ